MINIIYEESTRLTDETKATIQDLAEFALDWYSNLFTMPVTDLDTMRFFLYPVEGHQGVFGIANDGANVDRVSVREDLYVDGDFTPSGYNTLCHELIHFCQYATDYNRQYDVPYAERPQEVQAFKHSQELLTAWRLSKLPVIDMPVVVEEDIEDEPNTITDDTPEPTNRRYRNLWVLLGTLALVAFFLTGCAGKSASDFSQAPQPQSVQQEEQQSVDQGVQQSEQQRRRSVLRWLFRLNNSPRSEKSQPPSNETHSSLNSDTML